MLTFANYYRYKFSGTISICNYRSDRPSPIKIFVLIHLAVLIFLATIKGCLWYNSRLIPRLWLCTQIIPHLGCSRWSARTGPVKKHWGDWIDKILMRLLELFFHFTRMQVSINVSGHTYFRAVEKWYYILTVIQKLKLWSSKVTKCYSFIIHHVLDWIPTNISSTIM